MVGEGGIEREIDGGATFSAGWEVGERETEIGVVIETERLKNRGETG